MNWWIFWYPHPQHDTATFITWSALLMWVPIIVLLWSLWERVPLGIKQLVWRVTK